jgi:arylsulfatase A-like enzyme
MKRIVPSVLCTFTLAGNSFFPALSQDKPNVILIITDDQGYGDLGITGNPHVKTPAIDSFGKESIRFTSFYVSPVSAPTRSSLMTGRYSMRTGVRDTNNGGAIMATSEITIAEILRSAGYATGIFGKWHLGDNYPFRPCDQGFDESLIHLGGGMAQPGDVTTYLRGDSAYFDPVLWHNGKQEKYKGYCTDIFAANAIRFIEQNHNSPFFCYLAFNAPHTPLQVPDKYYNMYKDMDPQEGFPASTQPVMNDRDKEDARRVYAMVSCIDDNVGKLLKKTEELGIAGKTIIIFMTDNGPQQRRYVAGMRGLKGSVFRGGVRVPFFLRYPPLGISNKEVDVVSAHFDILPTIASLCKVPLPEGVKIDGRSLVPFIKSEKPAAERSIFFYWTRRNPEKYNNVALMNGNYRFVGQTDQNAGLEDFMLFDTEKDPSELNNITKANLSKASAMKEEMDRMITELTSSENMLNPPYIIIGNGNENPAILNRNDADGERGVWEQEDPYGFWRVDIREGSYNIKFRFKNPVPGKGRMMIDLKSISFQQFNAEENTFELKMNEVHIPGGKCDFYPYYEVAGKRILPLWVEIEKI